MQFTDFVADPLTPIAGIYAALGRELTAETEARMRAFLASNPGDGGGGGTRYRWPDTGLDADQAERQPPPTRSGTASRPNPSNEL